METFLDNCNLENISFTSNTFEKDFLKNRLSIIKAFTETWDKDLRISQQNQNLSKKTFISSQHKKTDLILNELSTVKIKCDLVSNANNETLNLKTWGLPVEIIDKYESRGVTKMFPWQAECLSNSKVLEDYGNLVYSAPTSGGKTLVAEILAIKNVLERRKKVIIILPFVSVVREKMFYFQDIFGETGIRVEGFMGSHTPPGGFQSINIAICTIEKANSLINKLLEENTISELGAVIVDELHLIGDLHRGYILELLLTKLMYISKQKDIPIQIIGMSATLPNLDSLSHWLEAELYKTDFRPIPLEEYWLMGNTIYDSESKNVRKIKHSEDLPTDKESIIHLCLETIIQNNSVLIFCPTKNWCENLAKQIAASFQNLGYSDSDFGRHLRKQLNSESISEVLEQLKSSPVGLDSILGSTISFGVGFHHAGLTMDERDIIESAFKKNIIRVLIATSTLSSGVNLPARRVIIRSPVFCGKPINLMTYKQMIGRAGRMGIDSAGESILICSPNDKKVALDLMNKEFDPISSCLKGEDKLMRAVLEAIASNVASTRSDVDLFINCTFLLNNMIIESDIKYGDKILMQLEEYELIRFSKSDEKSCYLATPLGKACLSSSMSPQDGLTLFIELQKARESFVLETDLHMIYLVTPYSICSQWGDINWFHFLNLWEGLSAAMKRVGKLVGIQESFIYKCIRSSDKNYSTISKKYQIYKRFYTALALQDLVNEISLNVVADKFNCSRGVLQSLQQSAATFAGMVTAFSQKLGWKNFEILVSQFQDRLQFGIQSELLDLMKLQSLNAMRARAIFNIGVETINQLAISDILTIENALNCAIPFQSDKIREGENIFDAHQRNNLKRIWITGRNGLTAKEAAELLILEARTFLQHEIGVTEVKWTSQPNLKCSQKIDKLNTTLHIQEYDITSTVKINASVHSPNNITSNRNHEVTFHCALSPKVIGSISPLHSTPIELKKVNSIHIEVDNQSAFTHLEESLFSMHSSNHCNDSKEKSLLHEAFCYSKENSNSNKNASSNIILINKSININDSANSCKSFGMDNLSRSLSLFEESFTIDTQLCHILDSKKSVLKEHKLNNNNNNESNINHIKSKSNLDLLSIEKAFLVSFEMKDIDVGKNAVSNTSPKNMIPDSQTDFKLNMQTNEGKNFSSTNQMKRKLSEDVCTINSSISEIQNCNKNMSPFKLIKLSKKSPIKSIGFNSNKFLNASIIDISLVYTKKIENPELRIIKYICCKNIHSFNEIHQYILLAKSFSFYLDFEEISEVNIEKKIGYNSLNINKKVNNVTENNFEKSLGVQYNIRGFSIFIEEFGVLYIDLCSNQTDKVYKETVLNILRKIFMDRNKCVIIYDCKKIFSILYKCFNIKISCQWEDPLIADWLLDSDSPLKPLLKMANTYCSYNIENLLNKYSKNKKESHNEILSIKAWASWCIMKSLKNKICNQQCSMFKIFEKEMEALQVLANSEVSGISCNKDTINKIINYLKSFQNSLERNAFKITGRRFNIASSAEVAKALCIYNGRKTSTNKRVLEKVESPLARTIIYWRKLNTILTKNLFPLLAVVSKQNLKRIYGTYWTHTSTGRMSMQEPNLQTFPRNFEIPSELLSNQKSEISLHKLKDTLINCRDIFSNQDKLIFISADYCQLELRLLAHMCQDATLLKIVNSNEDIFSAIASSWKGIQQEQVDDELRQRAKQMCYGIIYGMGTKALAECLSVCETDAAIFMKTFHSAYPGIKAFTNVTIESCRRLGYVETITGRRRYLPAINSTNYSEKSHSERQALNTVIQGSASDILKSAMISVNQKIVDSYNEITNIKLVLLLHDELIYEVPNNKLNMFYHIMKNAMESAIELSVPLPVKIKIGKSWGKMNEYIC